MSGGFPGVTQVFHTVSLLLVTTGGWGRLLSGSYLLWGHSLVEDTMAEIATVGNNTW